MTTSGKLFLFLVPLALGFSLRGRVRSGPIHRAVTDLFFPVLVFELLLSDPPGGAALGVSFAFLGMMVAGMTPVGLLLARALGRSRGEVLLPVAFMNSGFLGIPACLLLAGEGAGRYAVLIDQAMSLSIYTYGLAMILPGGWRRGLVEVARAPATWALVFALALGRAGWRPSDPILTAMGWFGRATVPLALFAVGLDLAGTRADLRDATCAAGARIVAGTALGIATLWTLRAALGTAGAAGDPNFARACLLESMMPSAVFSAVLPARYGAAGTLPATIVLVSTVLFPIWAMMVLAVAG